MPFEIGTFPEDSPHASSTNKGGFGVRILSLYARTIPLRTDLEKLDTLPFDAKTQVKLRADVGRRPALANEGANRFLYSLALNIVQRHVPAT
jgi:hypothetical protein